MYPCSSYTINRSAHTNAPSLTGGGEVNCILKKCRDCKLDSRRNCVAFLIKRLHDFVEFLDVMEAAVGAIARSSSGIFRAQVAKRHLLTSGRIQHQLQRQSLSKIICRAYCINVAGICPLSLLRRRSRRHLSTPPSSSTDTFTSMKSAALALTSGRSVRVLDFSESEDLKCRNLMCERIGGPCVCRLARYVEQHAESLEASLEVLDISMNGIPAFPESILKLKGLRTLNLSGNCLTELDIVALAKRLQRLETLDVRENPHLQLDASSVGQALEYHKMKILT